MALHNALTGADIHIVPAFTYANATARNAATGFTSADLYKAAIQTDNNSLWMLTSTTPTWAELTNTTGGGGASNQVVAVVTKTGAYTITSSDQVVLVDASAGAVTITLPLASGVNKYIFTVKKIDSSVNAVTIARTSSDTIDGATSQTIGDQYQSLTFVSNGSVWYIV